MTQENEIKSKAFLIYDEFGPDLRTPRPERLAKCFPETSEQTRETWLKEFKEIQGHIWKIAEQGGHKNISFELFTEQTKILFPFMNSEALQRAWFRVNYYVWHEGY